MVILKFLNAGACLAVLEGVLAQTTPGFPVSASGTLDVTYGTNVVSPPGELIPRPGMQI